MLQNIKQIKLVDLSKIIKNYHIVVIDSKVMNLYKKDLVIEPERIIEVDEPEQQKNYAGWERLNNEFLARNISRKDKVLVIGGGALSDLAGFAAASVLRGVPWSVIPTTLLAMVDAAIGGKVGINHDKGKNLIGAFSQAETVYLTSEFLNTLSRKELNSGLGEVIKYGFLSPQVFSMITHKAPLETIIHSCATYKQSIVEKDYKEGGERKLLNLGHTFGHAYEKMYNLPHGVAVLIGIKAIISLFKPSLEQDLTELIEKLSLNIPKLSKESFQVFWDFVLMDKKRLSKDVIELIVPRGIGQVGIERMDLDELKKAMKKNEFFNNFH
jgi:3-dehydroquinate synthase